jgi:ABC-type transporter Mla MlaB component
VRRRADVASGTGKSAGSGTHSMTKRKKGTANHRSRTPSPRSEVFALSASCTVTESAALKSALLEILPEPTPVTLDVARLQRIDTAGMQLIVAFVRERESHGLRVEWRSMAPTFTSAAHLLGVASLLQLPERA